MNKYISYLDELIDSLNESGNQSALCFEKLKLKVKNIKTDDDLKDFLDGVLKIATIAQYGDFTPKQDKLFTKLLVESEYVADLNP